MSIAVLRRLLTTTMSSSSSSPSSRRLALLTGHLRLSTSSNSDEVFSSVAVPNSSAGDIRPDATAAVLVCLFDGGGHADGLRVILTKRASTLSSHSGEVALPGGKKEEGDVDETATALREANEEIGLDPKLISVVSVLEPFLSKHLLRVVPVIGMLFDTDSFKPVLNKDEVEEIFDAPLEMFLKNENWRSEERQWRGVKYLVHYFDYCTENKKFVIWGLTASILIRAASDVYQRQPSFPEYPRFGTPSP